VRLLISGSAPLLASVHQAFEQRTGHVILERYGMTETSMLTTNPLQGERKAGTVGPPLEGVSVRVVEASIGPPLPQGEIGQIEVSGPNVFAGYWQRPDLASTEFCTDGFFRTGDIGVFDADGYLSIVGRSKDLIISGGLNVYPKEIEEAIDALPEVLESAVIGIPDADFGEAVVAIIVGADGSIVDPESVRTTLRKTLASYKVPKQIHVVHALPRNALGKVEKVRLREKYANTLQNLS
jgi:malonyl-CoA/methylmalonyl-CoA synthetase